MPCTSGLSVRTLRGYLADTVRPLPHFRVGGNILVRRSEFDLWVGQFRAVHRTNLRAVVDDIVNGFAVRYTPMGVKVRFWKRAWWVFVHHEGRRKAKCVGDQGDGLAIAAGASGKRSRAAN